MLVTAEVLGRDFFGRIECGLGCRAPFLNAPDKMSLFPWPPWLPSDTGDTSDTSDTLFSAAHISLRFLAFGPVPTVGHVF
jgi:hypothetical protein